MVVSVNMLGGVKGLFVDTGVRRISVGGSLGVLLVGVSKERVEGSLSPVKKDLGSGVTKEDGEVSYPIWEASIGGRVTLLFLRGGEAMNSIEARFMNCLSSTT